MELYEKYNKELADHTISDIKIKRFRARYPRLHGKNAKRSYHGFGGEVTIVQLFTDRGASGWGSLMRKCEKQLCDKANGKKVSELFAADTGVIDNEYLALDIALHDLAGNILNIPVRQMINPQSISGVKVYDGAIYMNDIIPEEKPFGYKKVIEESQYDYELGHRTFKIKIGRGNMWMEPEAGLNRDIEIVRGIHQSIPDAVLMVDGNDGFTPETMERFLEGIGGCSLYWIEEPFREEETNNRRLREYLNKFMPGTYIADGESKTDIPLLFDLAGKGLMDIWQPDICGYGFTAWRALMKQLVVNGYMASPHAWGDVIKTHYCAHLAAAYPLHIPCIEAVLGDSEGIDYCDYKLKNGIMTLPEKPGFGMDLIWAPEVDIINLHN